MELFDTHFHYYAVDEEPLKYAEKARMAGVRYLLAVGATYEESKVARRFSSLAGECWFSAGVHPHEASAFANDISMFDEFTDDPKLAALGEVGLDYFYENSGRDEQCRVFSAFCELALTHNLPLIVHCRDKQESDAAYADAYPILSGFFKRGGRFVLHCYTGTRDWCGRFLELGAYISVGGIITFPKAANVRELLEIIPDGRLLLETDSPYLAPIPHRGKRNHPEYLALVAEHVARLKGMPVGKIAEITTANAFSLFKLSRGAQL
ncbi:MAG: TatD family hydrolase [Victivallales bacterium]|jgi:TatD DNase family protein